MCSLELPRPGGSNEYPQSMFLSKNKKKKTEFFIRKSSFLVLKFSIYLNRHVFVMFAKNKLDFLGKVLFLISLFFFFQPN